jgi:unsaturated rhamnogalacturonyl hydrolase
MSATAALGYAALKGFRLHLLDSQFKSVGERTVQAALANIEASGIVANVSGETSGFIAYGDYNQMPTKPRLYGQTLTILLLTEALRSSR